MMMSDEELKKQFDTCVWRIKGHSKCKKCVSDCDLMNLEYTSKAIFQRIEEERQYIKEHHAEKEKKDVIKDKVMGILLLTKAYHHLKRLRR